MVEKMDKEFKLETKFKEFAKFGKPQGDGKQITLTNLDKWLKEAVILDGKKISTTDTAILFQRWKSKTIDFKMFLQLMETLAKDHQLNPDIVKDKLLKCSAPSTSQGTKVETSNVVSRMTDASKYTGTHKERFTKDGKGKGKAGREDLNENAGYVQGYKHKDTYGKKTK